MRIINRYFIIAALFITVLTATYADNWIKDAATGCRLWNPNPQKHETIIWHGSVEDGKAGGYGIAIWKVRGKETERAAGQWKNGRLHGVAVWTHTNGSMYAGDWENGSKSGCGIYTWPDGSIFMGEYENDRRKLGRIIGADGKRAKAIESSQIRSLVYRAQDAAILARKAATKAEIANKNRQMIEAAATAAAVKKMTQANPAAKELETQKSSEPEEDPSAK